MDGVTVFLLMLCVACGGLSVGLAIDRFRKKRYILFGTFLMTAIYEVLFMIKLFLS